MNSTELLKNKVSVPNEFNSVAKKYDLATGLSQGYQKDLILSAERMKLIGNEYIADLCCGTGKSTMACKKFLPNGIIVAVDNSEEMLKEAETKFDDKNIIFSKADVMELDYPDNFFDAIFMAYGIRNMPDYEKCLLNLKRMLKPGGVVCFHEYSLNENLFSRLYWRILGYLIIIPISTILSGSSKIYRYLVKSVLNFPSPNKFVKLLSSVGFQNSTRISMPSWRKPILHTFIAYKSEL